MSVTNSYVVVDWARLQSLPTKTDLLDYFLRLAESDDEDDDSEWQGDWSRRLDFGGYAYESWRFFSELSDWFGPLRGEIESAVERPFTQLHIALGILFDGKPRGPAAIKQGVEFGCSGLIASISPPTVEELCGIARALDRGALEREFDRVLSQHPFDGFPNGRAFVDWVDGLQEGLASVRKDEGILVLCRV